MRIHTDFNVTSKMIKRAANLAGADVSELTEHSSRSHDQAFNLYLTGTSARRPNGRDAHAHAATWDQWGIVLGVIFNADPEAKTSLYANGYDFHWQTGERFSDPDNVVPADMHGDHKFDYVGQLLTNASLSRCRKCSATKRWSY